MDGYGIHSPTGSVLVAFDGTGSRELTAYGPGGQRSGWAPATYTFEQPLVELRLPIPPRRMVGDPLSARPVVASPLSANRLLTAAAPPATRAAGGTGRPARMLARLAATLPGARGLARLAGAAAAHGDLPRRPPDYPPRGAGERSWSETVRPSRWLQSGQPERGQDRRSFPAAPLRRTQPLEDQARPGAAGLDYGG